MFERFTDEARHVLVLAQEEAHSFIGTEHLLLGLIHEGEGVAAKALKSMGITLETVREKVEETIGMAGSAPSGSPPFTPRAKKVLELALREMLQLGDRDIGTEHLLLGLVHEGEGVGARVLVALGADPTRVRQTVIGLLPKQHGKAPETVPDPPRVVQRLAPQEDSCSFCGRDLWEVARYVSAGQSVICANCIDAAKAVLAEVPAQAGRELFFPPRIFGDVPDEDAIGAITEAFRMVFGGGAGGPDGIAEFVEDGTELRPSFEATSQRTTVRPSGARVDRIRFVSPDLADVRFQIVLQGGGVFPFDGQATHRGGKWLVSRTTVAIVLGRGGVQLPPRG